MIPPHIKDFISIASHELEAPNRHISFFVDRLCELENGDNRLAENLSFLKKASQQLDQTLEGVFQVMKIYLEKEEQKISFKECLSQAESRLKQNLKDKSFEVAYTEETDLPLLPSLLFVDFFEEIFKNSYFYVEKRDIQVKISTYKESDHHRIVIQDNGETEFSLKGIFDPFFKGANLESSGLGLFFCKALIMKYGGDISLISTPSGAEVSVKLPFV